MRRLFGYAMAPMILGFVLGIMIVTALILLAPILQWLKDRRGIVTAGEDG